MPVATPALVQAEELGKLLLDFDLERTLDPDRSSRALTSAKARHQAYCRSRAPDFALPALSPTPKGTGTPDPA
jgi:hypothetical protein